MRRPVVVPRRGEFLWARMRARRRDLLWWSAATVLAVISVAVVGGALGRADAAAARWGSTHTAWVTTRTVETGERLASADVRPVEWPEQLVPTEAVATDPTGRTVTEPMGPGDPLTERRLAPDGIDGATALLAPGTRAVAIPTPAGGLSLGPGDLVDVVATIDPLAPIDDRGSSSDGAGVTVVAAAATVVSTRRS
ncbi:MAG: SAF domain-containing protein, partial [Actinomycetota bacterium]